MAGAWLFVSGHNKVWVEDAEPTLMITGSWPEFHIKTAMDGHMGMGLGDMDKKWLDFIKYPVYRYTDWSK